MTPVLKSRRLILHPYEPGSVKQLHVDWLNNKTIMQFSEQRHYEHSLRTQHAYARSIPENCHIWLIRLEGNDIGTISATVDTMNQTAAMGILLGREQGQGFAVESWRAVMEWLFSDGIEKVECGCMGSNWSMRKLAIACGMQLDGIFPKHFKVGDKRVPAVWYGRSR